MSDLNYNQKADKKDTVRTVVAVILSFIIMSVGLWVTNLLSPPDETAVAQQQAKPAAAKTAAPAASVASAPARSIRPAGSAAAASGGTAPASGQPAPGAAGAAQTAPQVLEEKQYTVSTDLYEAVFTNRGGDLLSLKLKKHKDQDGIVDLVLGPKGSKAFTVSFGSKHEAPVNDLMSVRMINDKTIEFSRTYLADVPGRTEPETFTYKKTYGFKDGEYLFGLNIGFENAENASIPLNTDGYSYTLSFAPQIGPRYNPASKNSDYRKLVNLIDGKRSEEKLKTSDWQPKKQPRWAGIVGKYFVFAAVPQASDFTTIYNSTMIPDLGQTTRIDFSRPVIKSSQQDDTYYFYFGPKTGDQLSKYNYSDKNSFGLADFHLDEAMDTWTVLRPLEDGIKWLLNLFYLIIPNYGVAILLVTILVKVLLFPLTKKSSISSARMQELQPQMQALQDKYKDNPQKLNQAMADFYKNEKFNPMSGCLPMLIQIPIFFAMYNLFNTHFDLRGAMFIPGWIPDLSAPESVWNFAPFQIPLLGWSDIRALPIIYLLSQIFYAKFTQQPQATGNSETQKQQQMSMTLMLYVMPIVFFFILYDVSSGLLVYWIASNLFTIVQQIVINNILKQRRLSLQQASAAVPQKRSSNPPVKGHKNRRNGRA